MRLCYLADAESIHAQRWLSYFADKGHEVHLISLKSFGDNNVKNVKLHALKRLRPQIQVISFPINLLLDTIQVRKLIKKIKPDIVHAHFVAHYGVLGALSGFHPFVVSAWGSDVLVAPKNSRIIKNLVKFTLKKADLVTCDGGNLRKALIELGTGPQRNYRVYWGTDTQKFNPEQRSEKIREDLGIFNSLAIISSKSLKPIYDIESLVRCIPLVLKKVQKAKFMIAGNGYQEAELKQLAKSLGVSDSVKFIGFISSGEFPKYLASADIYVCTSLSDGGLAISTKEAMACRLPVVITDLEVNTEWIKDGENGFIVPLKDSKALSEKIIYLIEHEDIRMTFGKLGRKLVKEKFEYNRELKKVENLYELLISRA